MVPPIAFAVQVLLAAACVVAAPRIARGPRGVWLTTCVTALGLMLLWPLTRVFPVTPIRLLGAPLVACVELTALAIPAALLFGVAGRHLPRAADRRAVLMLTVVAALYFVKAGWWMVAPGVPAAGATRIDANGICWQSTGYTCVAASMVTMLRRYDIEAEEMEMARLAHTQINGGATDSRALWALQTKLAGTPWRPLYEVCSPAELTAATIAGPCLVQLDWGYFVSHMVPVMSATAEVVVIGDPLSGERTMAARDFAAKWKGAVIRLVKRSPEDPQTP